MRVSGNSGSWTGPYYRKGDVEQVLVVDIEELVVGYLLKARDALFHQVWLSPLEPAPAAVVSGSFSFDALRDWPKTPDV